MNNKIDMHLEMKCNTVVDRIKAERLLAYFIGFWMEMVESEKIPWAATINGKEVKKA